MDKIRELLEKNERTQRELGEHMGVSTMSINSLVNGRLKKDPLKEVRKLAEFFGIKSWDELLGPLNQLDSPQTPPSPPKETPQDNP